MYSCEVENWQAYDPAWDDEKEEIEDGFFDRWGGFVKQEYLLEVAIEEVQNSEKVRSDFLDKIFDYIEENKEATETFLKWFYPDCEVD